MKAGSETIGYQLYQDSGRTQVWGSTVDALFVDVMNRPFVNERSGVTTTLAAAVAAGASTFSVPFNVSSAAVLPVPCTVRIGRCPEGESIAAARSDGPARIFLDLSIVDGAIPAPLPVVLGHEAAGEVVAVVVDAPQHLDRAEVRRDVPVAVLLGRSEAGVHAVREARVVLDQRAGLANRRGLSVRHRSSRTATVQLPSTTDRRFGVTSAERFHNVCVVLGSLTGDRLQLSATT